MMKEADLDCDGQVSFDGKNDFLLTGAYGENINY